MPLASSDNQNWPLWVGLVALYFLPTLVAYSRHNINRGAVAVVDAFLGWTVIGWIVALAMAAGGRIEKPESPAQTVVSPDGRHFWDGSKWIPIPGSPSPPPDIPPRRFPD